MNQIQSVGWIQSIVRINGKFWTIWILGIKFWIDVVVGLSKWLASVSNQGIGIILEMRNGIFFGIKVGWNFGEWYS